VLPLTLLELGLVLPVCLELMFKEEVELVLLELMARLEMEMPEIMLH
jgi:hypothetical protein